MAMLSFVGDIVNAIEGVEVVADLGTVFEGPNGYSDCRIDASITSWEGTYYARVLVENRRTAGTKTRVFNWPYSQTTAGDLGQYCQDWQFIEKAGLGERKLPDNRGTFERAFDYVLRFNHQGSHVFTRTVPEVMPLRAKLTASIYGVGETAEVTLSEVWRPGRVIVAIIPHAASAKICGAFANFALSQGEV